MGTVGGLKLALEPTRRDDRRVRFARVVVAPLDGGREETTLVTDSGGRLRYRLSPGEYRLHVDDYGDARFAVSGRGWKTVRLRLR
jgi:hypothetical protein